jgi:hypothetical protein
MANILTTLLELPTLRAHHAAIASLLARVHAVSLMDCSEEPREVDTSDPQALNDLQQHALSAIRFQATSVVLSREMDSSGDIDWATVLRDDELVGDIYAQASLLIDEYSSEIDIDTLFQKFLQEERDPMRIGVRD